MSSAPLRPVPLRPAATVVLLRNGRAGVEVFMVRRHGHSVFMAGATVFPGGKVDPVDGDLKSMEPGTPAPAFRACALRELHEEAGVLLAVDATGRRVPSELASRLREPLEAIRDGYRVDAAAHLRLLAARRWSLDPEAVVPFARWVTPETEPRRFDTWFFAALAPPGQVATFDGYEHTAGRWLPPAEALARHEAGEGIRLPPPTLHTLVRIASLEGDAAAVRHRLAATGPVSAWTPHRLAEGSAGLTIVLPDDADHPDFDSAPGGPRPRHRFVLHDGRFRYEHEV